MIGKAIGAALAAVLLATSAGAATLNFGAQGAVQERVVQNQTMYYDGIGVTFKAGGGRLAIFDDLFQGRESGLGVCARFNATVNRCSTRPNDEDNIGRGDTVTLMFDKLVNLSGMLFRGMNHYPVDAPPGEILSSETLLINGKSYTFGEAMGATFKKVGSITFGYGGKKAEEYYVNSIDAAPVPLPPAVAMLLAGLGALGFAGRRRTA